MTVTVTDDTTYRNALALNSMLLEYRLESVLGAGSFGMTYLGWDSHLEKHVAIKEYLPGELAIRALDGSVVPVNTESEYNYKWGLDRFIQEARTLAKFSHPNIVRVNRFFEANGTSYMVMDYEAGESLYEYLQRVPMPDEGVLKSILLPILAGLEAIHQTGFLHRDIKPSNVFMRKNGAPLLIDFGASRLAAANSSKHLTAIVSPGYAPLEQYSGDGNQGPWSDIYALAGVMYRAVTGENPPDAIKRMKADSVPAGLAAARRRYDERFLRAIEWGLKIDEMLRPQNVAEWREIFSGRVPISALDRAAGNAATMPPRALSATVPAPRAMAAAVAQKTAVRSAVTQSALRTGTVTPSPWKWLWRGVFFCVAAIAAASLVKPRVIEREPHKQAAQVGRPAADLQRQVATRFAAADTDHSGELNRAELTKRLPRFASRFDEMDANHDGVVTLRELEQFLEKDGAADEIERAGLQGPPTLAPALFTTAPQTVKSSADAGELPAMPLDMRRSIAEAFRRADAGGTGNLTRGEVNEHIPRIADKFDSIDANHDDRITMEEIEAAWRAEAAGKAAPVGGDARPAPGLNGKRAGAGEDIPFSVKKEFMAADRDADGYLSAWEVRGRFPAIERNLGEVDTDRDGRISLEEFAQFRRKMTGGKSPQS